MSLYALYPYLIRPFVFMLDPEDAHTMTIKAGRMLSSPLLRPFFGQSVPDRPVEVMGLKFRHPLGLAAGMDKNGDCIDYLGGLGFSHLELGTVTPRAQEGNPRPRMFRVKEARGLINRMGFNNKGVDYLTVNLTRRTYKGIIGVSIGKNETTPLENAADDYLYCMRKVYAHCDYIAVNVSCPNTPGLTALQEAEPLVALIRTLKEEQKSLSRNTGRYVPLVVKISPDLTPVQLEAVCDACVRLSVDGMSCTNTTTDREVIHGLPHAGEWGGLSGEPLKQRSTEVLKKVAEYTAGKLPLIGIGGISGAVSAREKLNAGASLLQLYSAFVYQGPSIIGKVVSNL
ncbi:MAG TPA: quinone-dependent dihydroorotate dehydrogenase [Candidatus Avisuccinivibrio pullicola]|nr:quinone-dependent dihydroorotate dehydrogenase [Candidatus Avisuccinivibrio pullicola]